MKKLTFNIAVLILIFAGIIRADDSGDFSFRVGMGYDFISQEYFVSSSRYDTSIISKPDAALDATLLEKDYLDDKKGLAYLKFNARGEGRQILEIGWEQTPEIIRTVSRGHFSLGPRNSLLEADFNFELKDKYKGERDAGENLSVLEGRLKYKAKVSETLESYLKLRAEKVSFDSTGDLIYNYSRIGTEFGLSFFTSNFSLFYFQTGLEKRHVSDSGQLDYMQFRTNLGYSGSLFGSQLNAEFSLENKNYDQPGNLDDYLLLTFYTYLRLSLGRNYYLRPELSFENFNYSRQNYISDDYLLGRSGLILGRQLNRFSITLGPKIEFLEADNSLENDDDYLEFYIFSGLDFFNSGGVFVLLENQFGIRNYNFETPYYSDFTFDRTSIIGALKLMGGLSFNILFFAEWEWHDISSDNNRLFLLSSGLTYTF